MGQLSESWNAEAKLLGYRDETEMLLDLYTVQGWSIDEMGKKLGYSKGNVRRRLLLMGVDLRSRGGKNNFQKSVLKDVPDNELLADIRKCALKHNVHVSTVHKEIRRRGLKCTSPSVEPVQSASSNSSDQESGTLPSHTELSQTQSTDIGTETLPHKDTTSCSITEPSKES